MDSTRYQRVQDLFWEAEEIEPHRWRDFLAERCGEDVALIEEVISLLREHDPEAALIEGNEVKPLTLPDSQSDAKAVESKTGRPDTKVVDERSNSSKRQPTPKTELTRKASQRTHAAPRQELAAPRQGLAGPRQGTEPVRRNEPSSSVKKRRVPSSIASAGRDRSPWSWVWVWLCLWIAGTSSIWVAAWYVGRTIVHSDFDIARRLLPTTLDRAKLQWQLLQNREREQCELIAATQVRNLLISIKEQPDKDGRADKDGGAEEDELANQTAKSKSTLTDASRIASRLPYVRNNLYETVIWNRKLQCVFASDGLTSTGLAGLIDEEDNFHLAPTLRSCLTGQITFWNGASDLVRPLVQDEPPRFGAHRFGWMIPIHENSSNKSPIIGVALLIRRQTWDRTQTSLDRLSKSNQMDAYLVDIHGMMRSESYQAREFLGHPPYIPASTSSGDNPESLTRISGRFRVAEYQGVAPDPGKTLAASNAIVPPLTFSANGIAQLKNVASPQKNFRRLTPYPNYQGVLCQGSWCWLPEFRVGIIVERPISFPPVMSDANPFGKIFNPLSLSWRDAVFFSFIAVPIISLLTFWQQRILHRSELRNRPLSRYAVQDELGSGGMGLVFRAKHLELGRDIAIKFLRDDCQQDDDQHRFDREARLAAMLSSPHSVTIFDYGRTAEGDAFCVMELLEGMTLYEVVARSGPQPPGRVVWIIQQICQSILEAHASGLMHRDLKPQNVMLRFDPTVGDYAVVFDFGLAKPIEPDQDMFQTAETIWAGTPMYMAPERFREPSVLDPRSDLYSIGCIAYYLLSGCPPFAECDPESMFGLIMNQLPIEIEVHRNESVDPQLAKWVGACMAKDKRHRSANVSELIETLQPISERLPWTRGDAKTWWDANSDQPSDEEKLT